MKKALAAVARCAVVVGRQRLHVILMIIFLLVILIQAVPHYLSADRGRPYESWDEIATYNNAHVLVRPASDRSFRYGSIDTFLQWIGIVGYDYLSYLGATHSHFRYSNHVPASWSDPFISFDEKTRYNYFRGTDDRNPIFISRRLHLAFAYCVVLAIGLTAIAVMGARAAYVLLPLLLLSVAPEVYLQTALSLPNAINAFLTFAVVLFAMLSVDRGQVRYLLLSAACFAIGLNFKPDIIPVGGAIALALCVFVLQGQNRFALLSGVKAAVLGGAVFTITDPLFFTDPVNNTRIIYHEILHQAYRAAQQHYVITNLTLLNEFLSSSLFCGVGIGLPFAIIIILSCLGTAAVKHTQPYMTVAIGFAVALVAWGSIVLKVYYVEDRYYLNGLAAFLAAVAMGLMLIERGRWRHGARIALAVIFVAYCSYATVRASDSLAMYSRYREAGGFDPQDHRTQASLLAIKTVKEAGYAPTVLVDQHAYIDLFPFRRAGIDARYINLRNVEAVISSLPHGKKYLILYGHGDYSYSSEWSQDLREAYDAYQARLSQSPVLRHYAGRRPNLLGIGPVNADAEVTVAILAIP